RRMTGFPADELIGMSDLEYTEPETAKRLYKTFNEVYRTGAPADVADYKVTIGDGSTRVLEFNVSLMRDEKGQPAGFRGIVRDATKRKEVEEAQRESEKKYRELFEKSEDAILIIHNGKFVDCNQAAIKMLRYNRKDELLNMHPSELSPEKQPDGKLSFAKADELMKTAFKNGSHRFEWYHKKSDGEIFPVEVLLNRPRKL
ncbi:MAG: PAS domain-containing protein, partial [Deltaproteobacteria bacterium]|nr:PAS domain-containing protein [Deltaproteobacteria bacterium]